MSAEAVTVVLHHSKAQGTAKLVLWGIANHHSDQGAWPSIATLAKYAGIKERRVQQIIRELAEIGELYIEEQGGWGYQQYKTNRYFIRLTCPADCDGTLQHKTGVQSEVSGVQSVTSRGAIWSPSGVQPTAPEPNKEPNKESPAKAERGMRLKTDFKPSSENLFKMQKEFPNFNLEAETEKFIDFWIAQPGGKKLDWQATWRNWIRNSAKRSGITQQKGHKF